MDEVEAWACLPRCVPPGDIGTYLGWVPRYQFDYAGHLAPLSYHHITLHLKFVTYVQYYVGSCITGDGLA